MAGSCPPPAAVAGHVPDADSVPCGENTRSQAGLEGGTRCFSLQPQRLRLAGTADRRWREGHSQRTRSLLRLQQAAQVGARADTLPQGRSVGDSLGAGLVSCVRPVAPGTRSRAETALIRGAELLTGAPAGLAVRLLPCPEAVEPAGWPRLCSPTGRTEHPESTCEGVDGGGHVLPGSSGRPA